MSARSSVRSRPSWSSSSSGGARRHSRRRHRQQRGEGTIHTTPAESEGPAALVRGPRAAGRALGDRRHQLLIAARRAELARGLSSTSRADGRRSFGVRIGARARAHTRKRELRRARATSRALAQKPLDDPVFERVEADDRQPPSGPQHLQCRRKPRLERLELVIDLDPEGLEHTFCGMPTEAEPERESTPGRRRRADPSARSGFRRDGGRFHARSGARTLSPR